MNNLEKDYTIGEDNICPQTGRHCDDECCMPGGTCNLAGDEISDCNIGPAVPTAEEFLDFDIPNNYDYDKAVKSAIEFAKLHVKAALRAASENVEMHYPDGLGGEGTITMEINKMSILEAYPESNIQ